MTLVTAGTVAPTDIEGTLARAAAHSPDPFPDDVGSAPDREWWYGVGEYEAGLLHRLVTGSEEVAVYSEYARNYRRPAGTLIVGAIVAAGSDPIGIQPAGAMQIWVDGAAVTTRDSDGPIMLNPPAGAQLKIEVTAATPDEPATFVIVQGAGRLSSTLSAITQNGRVERLRRQRGGSQPPHLDVEPTFTLPLTADGDLLTAPAELLARPVVAAAAPPTFASGESREEARLARGAGQEDVHETVPAGPGLWTTRHAVAMRHIVVAPQPEADAHAVAHIRPVASRGAFVCSDPRLSKIWAVSAYTLRLCMQGLMVDGLKRDRMPWVGDQAISAMANAFTFADAEIAYDSHLALGRPVEGYVNGISDYSLWWLITADILWTYFPHQAGDLPGCVEPFIGDLLNQANADGLFAPTMTHHGFTATNSGSVLIDWGYELPPGSISTALQMLWVRALDSAKQFVDGTLAAQIANTRDRALRTLRDRAWSAEHGAWRACADGASRPDTYANFLAVDAGISNPVTEPGVLSAFTGKRGRTPYMQTLLLRAETRGAGPAHVLQRIRDDWGAMLDLDATTFWEEFPNPGESHWQMYGRPYARSLCHAWGAGPAALIPEAVFGLRMLEPGWRRFEVRPGNTGLEWAALVIPSALGPIGIRLTEDQVDFDLPPGCTAILAGNEVRG
ncbi:hypothetical protein JNB63_20010 [Microbacterium trichothecenolyticum]|uniref:Alpha-L-rhamnosidase six-hairpin glycosidase domain-containing protein n=1 Tax=Microbacterium ureisolvens TaxID=2781186 RepID=A0ABS7I3U6_9MICO|nr:MULTISPECIES: hypothetical protein [Microbacterium]MBW9111948.1 hypothetical protein [Microbacterium ureisolvens]MBW9122383.1 hypothetical protein [Microbacterium trichothecenolyticum]